MYYFIIFLRSLGITLYALVYGNVPFWDSYVIALHKKIKTEPLRFPKMFVLFCFIIAKYVTLDICFSIFPESLSVTC